MRRSALVFAAFAWAGLAAACPNLVPPFALRATDGRTIANATLIERPTLLVFVKATCPANAEAFSYLATLRRELGASVEVLPVVRGSLESVRQLGEELRTEIPIVSDPNGQLFAHFRPQRSLQFAVIATKKEARWAKVFPALSREELARAVESIVKHGHANVRLNTARLPEGPLMGCMFR